MAVRELDILAFIKDYINARHYPPSIREIADGCDLSSTSQATYYLSKLENQGKIHRAPNTARGIVVNE